MTSAFYLTIGIFTLILVGVHFLIYGAFVHFWKLPNTLALKLIVLVISLSFAFFSILTSYFYSKILSFFYTTSAILLGTVYWLFWSSLLAFILYFIFRFFQLSSVGLLSGKILLLAALLISIYGVFNSYHTKVIQYEVALPNLPPAWQNKEIVLVADTHLGNVRHVRFMKKIAALISAQNPELVLVAGDFIDGPPTKVKPLVEALEQVKSTKGIYFANGNHETYFSGNTFYDALSNSHIKVLNDAMTDLNGLQIVGVDYLTTKSEKEQAEVLKALPIDPNKPSILIKHVPNAIPSAQQAGIDLQVSGHSHKGQVWPGPWLTSRVYGIYAYGQQKYKDMTIITTSGAGTWGPPQRVGTNGEIVVITLVSKES